MPSRPTQITIRTYQVGFGDCFLLSFKYARGQKHLLVDFGSTRLPKGAPKDQMTRVAKDIEKVVGKDLVAVVATHRHKDHISGFATNTKGNATGNVIRNCKPKFVLQPWTEDPKLKKNAKGPTRGLAKSFVATLDNMHAFAAGAHAVAKKKKSSLGTEEIEQIRFIGDDNIANRSAIQNLATMGRPLYLSHGKRPAPVERLLPGVRIDVLGPPTLTQTSEITKQRSKDRDEFWTLQAQSRIVQGTTRAKKLFPNAKTLAQVPPETRWFCDRLTKLSDRQLLSIVRILDKSMNNTSLILLLTIGKKRFLFPGDAQIENWTYALQTAANHKQMVKNLAAVDVYKVGHHGSLNATPMTLWNGFKKRTTGKTKKMKALMSTMPGVHGSTHGHTEVPRQRLVEALGKETDLHRTDKQKDPLVDTLVIKT